MKIVFVMRHSGYVRNFESTLRLLAQRGHQVHLAFQASENNVMDPRDLASQLVAEFPSFTDGIAPARDDAMSALASELRTLLDYFRYLEPPYRSADKLRARARRRVVSSQVRQLVPRVAKLPAGLLLMRGTVNTIERSIPRAHEVDAFIRRHAPDVLLVTPFIEIGAPQVDYLRSARELGVRTALPVYSWDNLSNKGVMREIPDLVTVWNEPMKREAVELHGVPPNRVVVTGAPAYDQWFDWRPTHSREAFCAQVGLPADRPYVLYVCSSYFIAPDEVSFVREWLAQLRAHPDARLRTLGVLVRPHPQNATQWQQVDLSDLGPATIWPRGGANPTLRDTKEAYFDSIYHSAGVMGINTSAMIESAIVGRPVFTLLAPAFRDTQEGTLHFHHLLHVNGGLLRVGRSFDEHAQQLLDAVGADDAWHAREADHNRRFLEGFVRPHGLDVPAAPRLVEAIEALAARPAPRTKREPLWKPLMRPALGALAGYRYTQVVGLPPPAQPRVTTPNGSGGRRRAFGLLNTERLGARLASARTPPEKPARNGHVDFASLGEEERLEFLWRNVDLIPEAFWQRVDDRSTRYGVVDYDRAMIRIRTSTKAEQRRLLACRREPWTVSWIEDFVAREDVLYDIGANVGVYGLVAALRPGSAARVVAFEPSSANFLALCQNIAINQVTDRLVPLPLALSDATEIANFHYRSLTAGAAMHVLEGSGSGVAVAFTPVLRQPVLTYRLDDVIDAFELPRPNHLKIDVDGSEIGVLRGAHATLRDPGLRSVMVEVGLDNTQDVTGLLEAAGLKLEKRIERDTKEGGLEVWYGLFAR